MLSSVIWLASPWSRPLPNMKLAAGNSTSTSARKQLSSKPKKSQIPVPTKPSSASQIKQSTTKTTSASKVRKVPDFAKLHKSWQQTFNKGKACNKKQCTEVREFDLTKPGTVFQPSYFSGKNQNRPKASDSEDDDAFQADEGALLSILNSGLSTPSKENARATMAGCGWTEVTQQKPSRQTLGALPTTFQGRTNNADNTKSQDKPPTDLKPTRQDDSENRRPRNASSRKMSLADQQKGMDINFEPDAGALASILNHTGASFNRPAPTARQTIGAAMGASRSQGTMFGGRQSQGPVRTSIYYQRPRPLNFDRVFTDYANRILSRLSSAENSLSTSNQPLSNTTFKGTGRGRQVNKAFSQSRLIMSAPRLTRAPATEGKPHSVKWADLQSPPGERMACGSDKDELATTLFADEDSTFTEPCKLNHAVTDNAQLQAACVVAKRDEIKMLEQQTALRRNKLEEMDEIERQLELEIQKLQQDNLLSPPSVESSESQRSSSQSSNNQIAAADKVPPTGYETRNALLETQREPQSSQMEDAGFPLLSKREQFVETGSFSRMPSEILDQKLAAEPGNLPRKFVDNRPTREMPGGLQDSFPEICQTEIPSTSELSSYPTGKTQQEPLARTNQPPLPSEAEHQLMSRETGGGRQYSTCREINEQANIPGSTTYQVSSFVAQEQYKTCENGATLPSTGHVKHPCTPRPEVATRDTVCCSTEFLEPSKESHLGNPRQRPTAWMSSTPAHIQTPQAIKPQSLIKELSLKKSLPATNRQRNHPYPQEPLPIHTPLAMRTMSTWNNSHSNSSASFLQNVSPIGLHASPTCLTAQSETLEPANTKFSPQQTLQNIDPTSDTKFPSHEAKTTNSMYPQHFESCHATVRTNGKDDEHRELHSLEDNSCVSSGQGSLSLGAELTGAGGAAAFLKSKLKPLLSYSTNQMFQEALLDEECALYACRLPSKFSSRPSQDGMCFDPVAKILMDGDDMHFVPIESRGHIFISTPVGSAFRSYGNIVK